MNFPIHLLNLLKEGSDEDLIASLKLTSFEVNIKKRLGWDSHQSQPDYFLHISAPFGAGRVLVSEAEFDSVSEGTQRFEMTAELKEALQKELQQRFSNLCSYSFKVKREDILPASEEFFYIEDSSEKVRAVFETAQKRFSKKKARLLHLSEVLGRHNEVEATIKRWEQELKKLKRDCDEIAEKEQKGDVMEQIERELERQRIPAFKCGNRIEIINSNKISNEDLKKVIAEISKILTSKGVEFIFDSERFCFEVIKNETKM